MPDAHYSFTAAPAVAAVYHRHQYRYHLFHCKSALPTVKFSATRHYKQRPSAPLYKACRRKMAKRRCVGYRVIFYVSLRSQNLSSPCGASSAKIVSSIQGKRRQKGSGMIFSITMPRFRKPLWCIVEIKPKADIADLITGWNDAPAFCSCVERGATRYCSLKNAGPSFHACSRTYAVALTKQNKTCGLDSSVVARSRRINNRRCCTYARGSKDQS
jgi:hypothetical protein